MEELTTEQQFKIRDSFDDPTYPQPHGETNVVTLLAAMISSGNYELEEYPRLLEAAFRLNIILVLRFNREVNREVRETTAPKPPDLEKDAMNSDSDYYPMPFSER